MDQVREQFYEGARELMIEETLEMLEKKDMISSNGCNGDYVIVFPLKDNFFGNYKDLQEQASSLAGRIFNLAAKNCREKYTAECKFPEKYRDPTFILVFGTKDSKERFVKLSIISSEVDDYSMYREHTDENTQHVENRDLARDLVQKGKFYRRNIDQMKTLFISNLRSYCKKIGHTNDIIFMSFASIHHLEKMFKDNEATFEEKNYFINKLNYKTEKVNLRITDLNVTKIEEVIRAMNLNDKQELKDKFLQCQKEFKLFNNAKLNAEKIRGIQENQDVEDALNAAKKEEDGVVPSSTLKKLSLISLGDISRKLSSSI